MDPANPGVILTRAHQIPGPMHASRSAAVAILPRAGRAVAGLLLVLASLALPAVLPTPALGQSPRPLSQSWMAARAGGGGGAAAAGISQSSVAAVQKSLADMQAAARAIAAQQAAQAALRGNALAAPAPATSATVPNGLAAGGLQPATTPWRNATLPTQTVANGRTGVTVKQTAAQAVATWTSFNVGRNTDLTFDQSAGGSAAGTVGGAAVGGIIGHEVDPKKKDR